MTVSQAVLKLQIIERLIRTYDMGNLTANNFDELISIVKDYQQELLKKELMP